ncbi:MAG TPA: urea transporter [Bacteroidales bacterium]|nr:urea transporter [Bacteroidales bacterium]
MTSSYKLFGKSLLNSYSQVFFSDNRIFALILIIVSFADFYAGLFGFVAVLTTNLIGFMMGFDKRTVAKGLYGFNSLLVGLGLGIYYEPGPVMFLIIILASVFTLFISVSMQGVIGKYGLPYLSIPFIIGAWIVTLAAREFTSLGLSERGIFTLNELYTLGGSRMVNLYEWWNSIEFARPVRIYFISLGAIVFQYNILAGIIISIGLLIHSRISFSLSILGFFTAYLFYEITGASISDLNYSYIGFNYILTSIAIGGFFIIPSARSYLWIILLVPVVAILTISLSSVFLVFSLPVYALPFNIIVLIFLYSLKFRIKLSGKLTEVFIQQNTPEKNLYSYENDIQRFRHGLTTIKLPFFGVWEISQAHNGEHTHKGDWMHAWDFVINDKNGSQFKGDGDVLSDYYCYNKPVIAVADGIIEYVEDSIPDNEVGTPNIKDNWGNTVIIRHNDFLYSSLSHLAPGSIDLKEGDRIKQGDIIARCGNSGRSPYPHLHFQLQATPYIGSRTLDHPLSYYIHHTEEDFLLHNFDYPEQGQKVSNIEINELLKEAFNFVPGKTYSFEVNNMREKRNEEWEVFTDEYNNPFLRCKSCGSKAYFVNDGNMLMFKHYEGKKDVLLYWFFLSVFKLQQGYYHGMEVNDQYPLNLFFRRRFLFFQDFLAPFILIFKSEFRLTYKSIDSELSSSRIELESLAINRVFGKVIRTTTTNIVIDSDGIERLHIQGKNLNIVAVCKK